MFRLLGVDRSVAPILACALLLTAAPAAAQSPSVYIIFDGSGSMWGQLPDGTHKVTAARDVLDEFVGQDFGERELALRAYGHRREADCSDTELAVPFAPASEAAGAIRSFAKSINPKGKTPISRSLRAALDDMGDRPGEIILISDGIETCDEDPCALVKAWREKNIAIKIHVVGLGLDEKEQAAMQCIADAAGTEYQDAQSAEELAAGLSTIRETAVADSEPIESSWQVLTIHATNAAGEQMRVVGTATREGADPIAVSNNGHSRVPSGTWEVSVGVETENGTIYQPVTQTVEVGTSGSTPMEVVVPEPPAVRARFVEAGEDHRGSLVTIYQDGEEIGGFRPQDRTYVDPGTYEFRSTPNADNELILTETFVDGDDKELLFELAQTVRVTLEMFSAGSNERFRSILELWQDGERKYKVNTSATVLPGVYDVHLPLNMTPHVHKGLTITREETQEYNLEVPVGHVTFRYQNADGSPLEARDLRLFPSRLTGERYKSDKIARANQRIPLTAGSFKVEGWSSLGDFDPVLFDIEVGDDKEVVLRAKE